MRKQNNWMWNKNQQMNNNNYYDDDDDDNNEKNWNLKKYTQQDKNYKY